MLALFRSRFLLRRVSVLALDRTGTEDLQDSVNLALGAANIGEIGDGLELLDVDLVIYALVVIG